MVSRNTSYLQVSQAFSKTVLPLREEENSKSSLQSWWKWWVEEVRHKIFFIVDLLIENAFVPYIIFAELALQNVIAINWHKSQLGEGLKIPLETPACHFLLMAAKDNCGQIQWSYIIAFFSQQGTVILYFLKTLITSSASKVWHNT